MTTSSITSDGRKVLINQFKNSLDGDSDKYYIGLSSADSSSAGLHDQTLTRNEMHFVKSIAANSFVVETNDWISGTFYNQYDNNDTNRSNFYVANSNNEVFMVIEQGKNSTGVATGSTVEPTYQLAAAYNGIQNTFPTGDGYLWRYLYRMAGSAINNFKTSEYLYKTDSIIDYIDDDGKGMILTVGNKNIGHQDLARAKNDNINFKAKKGDFCCVLSVLCIAVTRCQKIRFKLHFIGKDTVNCLSKLLIAIKSYHQ